MTMAARTEWIDFRKQVYPAAIGGKCSFFQKYSEIEENQLHNENHTGNGVNQ